MICLRIKAKVCLHKRNVMHYQNKYLDQTQISLILHVIWKETLMACLPKLMNDDGKSIQSRVNES